MPRSKRPSQIEPLPDIDFNIRAGNTLVGFATLDQVRKTVHGILTDDKHKGEIDAIVKEAEYVEEAYRMFREIQTVVGMQGAALSKAKQNLRARLDRLNAKLDRYLAGEYGVNIDMLVLLCRMSSRYPVPVWRRGGEVLVFVCQA